MTASPHNSAAVARRTVRAIVRRPEETPSVAEWVGPATPSFGSLGTECIIATAMARCPELRWRRLMLLEMMNAFTSSPFRQGGDRLS